MNVAILTLPLFNNYGGILQAYALSKAIDRISGDGVAQSYVIRFEGRFRKLKSIILRVVSVFVGRQKFTPSEIDYISKDSIGFMESNLRLFRLGNVGDLSSKAMKGFDAIVVGSDQVWRPKYAPRVKRYFLDFVDQGSGIKRVAYAASFGVDRWEFGARETRACSALAKRFNAVSVREDVGVGMCKERFGVLADHVLDPTLLLSSKDYIELAGVKRQGGRGLMVYTLDRSTDKNSMVRSVAAELGLSVYEVNPRSAVKTNNIEDSVFPPIEDWIAGFAEADFVVTDSFHGTVFSIIFNKPFVCIGNAGRGISRFTSLLKMFSLRDRLVMSASDITPDLLRRPINFEKVNQIWAQERVRSLAFLKSALGLG